MGWGLGTWMKVLLRRNMIAVRYHAIFEFQ